MSGPTAPPVRPTPAPPHLGTNGEGSVGDEFMEQLNALLEKEALRPLQPGELSHNLIAEQKGIPWGRARHIINKWMSEGTIEFAGYRLSAEGRREKAYRFVKTSPPTPLLKARGESKKKETKK